VTKKVHNKNARVLANPPERRASRRYPVGWVARLKGLDAVGVKFDEAGTIKNLSSTGALVYLTRQVRVGAKLEVMIRVPFGRENWMEYPARVIRIDSDAQTAVAVKFSALKPSFLSERQSKD